MSTFYMIVAFLPEEAMPLMIALAGIAIMLGFRRVGGTLIVLVVTDALLLPFIGPLIDGVPRWVLLVIAVFVIVVVLRGLSRAFSRPGAKT